MALFRARVQLVFTASTLNFRCSLVLLLLWGHRQGWEPLTAVQGSERSMYQSTHPHLKKYECFCNSSLCSECGSDWHFKSAILVPVSRMVAHYHRSVVKQKEWGGVNICSLIWYSLPFPSVVRGHDPWKVKPRMSNCPSPHSKTEVNILHSADLHVWFKPRYIFMCWRYCTISGEQGVKVLQCDRITVTTLCV